MSWVLGVSCGYHDAAVALVRDGEVVLALQEERLSGVKNDASVPLRAISAVLADAGLCAADLECVAYYENPYATLERVLVEQLRGLPRSLTTFADALRDQLSRKIWVLDALARGVGVPRERVRFGDHHASHAAAAAYAAEVEHAAVLTVDGVGEATTTTVSELRSGELRRLASLDLPHSIGLVYAAMTAFLGFEVNEGEFKVMGLAAYGKPRFAAEFERIVRIQQDGMFEVDPGPFLGFADPHRAFGPECVRLFGEPRPYGLAWELSSERDLRYADIAASLQARTEDVLLGLARFARARMSTEVLCLAGGVALNAVAIQRLREQSGFARVIVPPSAGDAGAALGAAWLAGASRPRGLCSAALGVKVDTGRLVDIARQLGLEVRTSIDGPDEAARRIAMGQIVGWVEGRSEWGARALGHRSLLGPAGDASVRERMNRVVKQREPFRPFAPAVLDRAARESFDVGDVRDHRFMTSTVRVHEHVRSQLAAVTHVDGTARVQCVDERAPFGRVLAALEREGGMPVCLNTSMNGAGDPIAATTERVLAFFVRHSVRALVVDDAVLEVPPAHPRVA